MSGNGMILFSTLSFSNNYRCDELWRLDFKMKKLDEEFFILQIVFIKLSIVFGMSIISIIYCLQMTT